MSNLRSAPALLLLLCSVASAQSSQFVVATLSPAGEISYHSYQAVEVNGHTRLRVVSGRDRAFDQNAYKRSGKLELA